MTDKTFEASVKIVSLFLFGNPIKKCPFCNSDNISLESSIVFPDSPSEHHEYSIICNNCGARGPNDLGKSGACEMWNMRRPCELQRPLDYKKGFLDGVWAYAWSGSDGLEVGTSGKKYRDVEREVELGKSFNYETPVEPK